MSIWPDNLYEYLQLSKPIVAYLDLMHAVVVATSILSKEDNHILLLKFTCGYDADMIAKRMGLASVTVSRHLGKIKNQLLEPTVRPLFEHGYCEGMKQIHDMFSTYENDFNEIPIEYAIPEPQILKVLQKVGACKFGDLNYDVSSIKGIGPKSADIILNRSLDLGWGSEIFYCEIAVRRKQCQAEDNTVSNTYNLNTFASSSIESMVNRPCFIVPDLSICQAEVTS